jgi:hypothetical protein
VTSVDAELLTESPPEEGGAPRITAPSKRIVGVPGHPGRWWCSPAGDGGLSGRNLERVASVLVTVGLRIVCKREREGLRSGVGEPSVDLTDPRSRLERGRCSPSLGSGSGGWIRQTERVANGPRGVGW